LGREQPSVRAAEKLAKAIWYDTPAPIRTIPARPLGDVQYPYCWRPYTLRDGSLRRVQVRVHPDPRVQAVVEQIREAEMLQGIDRLRLIHSVREKTVFILCNIPLDIPIDRLVTWRQLAGDSRLVDGLAACEENGWEALPLAAQSCGTRPEQPRAGRARTHWTPLYLLLDFGVFLWTTSPSDSGAGAARGGGAGGDRGGAGGAG
jgi:hypothetical protein